MAFTAGSINYATEYKTALSNAYPNVLHFGALFARRQEADYKWTGAKTIEIPSITTKGRTDANRDSIGTKSRNYNNAWTPLTLRNHRKWGTLVHPSDIRETEQAASISNITKTFNETQKFPEMDKYLISTLYSDWGGMGRVGLAATLSTSNILTYFDYMMETATEKNVPASGRILYVTPAVDTILKNAQAFYRNYDVKNQSASIQRAISNLDSVSIEVVPSDHMLTAYDFTEGAAKGASAKQILMFLVHPSAIITPVNYEFAQLDPPSAGSEGKWEYFEESQEDVFILPNKEFGLDFVTELITNGSASFSTAASAASGAVAGDFNLTVTAPTGTNLLSGSRYFYATAASTAPDAPAYGAEITREAGWTEWDGTSVLNAANGHKLTLVVADRVGRVYYAGNGTITSKT